MCGIVGYAGKMEAKNIMLDALELLEYRGYDSAGIAVCNGETGSTDIYKCAGRVSVLERLCEGRKITGGSGIGHTRWATHGVVSDENAHPHRFERVTVVHNGIIENYRELTARYQLEDRLHSGTDSEVAAAVLAHFYEKDPYAAIRKAVLKLKGTFALAIMFEDIPGTVFAVRNVSPIVIAHTQDGSMLASDVTVAGRFSKEYFVLPEYHVAMLSRDKVRLFDMSGEQEEPEWLALGWNVDRSGKGGYPFYMEKEIMEQPEVLRETLKPRIREGLPDFVQDGIPDSLLRECERVCVIACGTAMHAVLCI